MSYIAVDYHKKYSYVTILDQEGKCLKEGKVVNKKESLKSFIGKYSEGSEAVVEATWNWAVMYDWLEEIVDKVKLAHPAKVRAIAEAKIKTDKIDANVLAQLLRCDLLPEAYVSDKETREVKNILRQRMYFVGMRTMLKNRLHIMLERHPELTEEKRVIGTDLFSKKGMSWIRSLKLRGEEQGILERELRLLEEIDSKVKESNLLVKRLGKKDERVQRVKTIPGMGDFFSLLMVTEIGDISRFRDPKKLAAYAGLVPSTYSSGGKTYHGRLIKQGNKWIRWAMVEAVWPAIRCDFSLRCLYEKIKKRKRPNQAKVVVAKRLLTILYRVLKENRNYEERPFNINSRLPLHPSGCYSFN